MTLTYVTPLSEPTIQVDNSPLSPIPTSPLPCNMMAVDVDPPGDDPGADPSISPDWVGIELADERDPLLLDTRSAQDFNAGHIQTAIHVTIPSLMLKRLKKGNLAVDSVIKCPRFITRWRSDRIIVYNEGNGGLASGSLLSLLHQRLTEDGCDVYYLQDLSSFRGTL